MLEGPAQNPGTLRPLQRPTSKQVPRDLPTAQRAVVEDEEEDGSLGLPDDDEEEEEGGIRGFLGVEEEEEFEEDRQHWILAGPGHKPATSLP